MPGAPRKLLLIGWDSADWKLFQPLMEAGHLPHLARLVEEGCMGRISTLHPVYSPMLWTSIATGKRPQKHGVLGFAEPLPDGSGIRPVSSLSRRTKAFWNIFHQQGWTGHVVGWWPSHPVEPIRGSMISNLCHRAVGPMDQPWPIPPGGMHPATLVPDFAELRFNPNELVPAMVEPFIPRAREINQDKDRRLAAFMRILAECVTVNNWGQWLVENTDWDYCCIYYDAMDHFGHGFMKYHPPRQPRIPELDFELFSNVVTQAAKFHDLMLGALLAKVPPDTTVVLLSDHGFHPDKLRPAGLAPIPAGPAAEHSDFGMLVLRGPGLRRDALLHGASILDIAPTLLTLFGLPLGADMDGRPLVGAFHDPPAIRYVRSWDDIPGDDGRHSPEYRQDPESEKAALDQLIALGYVAAPGPDVRESVECTQRELDFNLAESYMDAGQDAEACPILERLCHQHPDEYRFALRLALCYRNLGRVAELRQVVRELDEVKRPAAMEARAKLDAWSDEVRKRRELRREAIRKKKETKAEMSGTTSEVKSGERQPLLTPEERKDISNLRHRATLAVRGIDYLKGIVALADRKPQLALDYLQEAGRTLVGRPGIHLQIGQAYSRLGRWNEARRAFHRAMEVDPDNPHAAVGLARVSLGQRRFEEAAGFAIAGIRKVHYYPLAHFLLGLALARLGRADEAANAWQTTVQLQPNYWPAHVRLFRWWRGRDAQSAEHHRKELQRIRFERLARGQDPSESQPRRFRAPAHTTVPFDPGRHGRTQADFAPQFLGLPRPPFPAPVITVVTGLPRSGTSLLMQMLTRGGVPALSDGRRAPDGDNPHGYFELEAVKALASDKTCLDGAPGHCVKIVLPLLPHLSPRHRYHVLFIERDLDEVLASQAAMLRRTGQAQAEPDHLRPAYESLVRRSRALLEGAPHVRTLRLAYRWLIEHPSEGAGAVVEFLGGNVDATAMTGAVNIALYRQRQSLAGAPAPGDGEPTSQTSDLKG